MTKRPLALAVALALALVGCGGGGGGDEATGKKAAESRGGEASATASPAATESGKQKAAPAATDGLTGYGATREAWNAAHEQAPGYTDGAAFLPLIDGEQPRYAAVSGGAGERIYSYTLSFPEGTNLDEAKRQVLQEFPAGAKFGIVDEDEPRCLIFDVRSPEVEAVMDGFRPAVAFFTKEQRSPTLLRSNVDFAIFTLASADETTDLGMC